MRRRWWRKSAWADRESWRSESTVTRPRPCLAARQWQLASASHWITHTELHTRASPRNHTHVLVNWDPESYLQGSETPATEPARADSDNRDCGPVQPFCRWSTSSLRPGPASEWTSSLMSLDTYLTVSGGRATAALAADSCVIPPALAPPQRLRVPQKAFQWVTVRVTALVPWPMHGPGPVVRMGRNQPERVCCDD